MLSVSKSNDEFKLRWFQFGSVEAESNIWAPGSYKSKNDEQERRRNEIDQLHRAAALFLLLLLLFFIIL